MLGLFAIGSFGASTADQRLKYEAPYSGSRLELDLEGTAVLACESEWADSTGYYNTSGRPLLRSSFQRQDERSRWVIALEGNRAHLIQPQDAPPVWLRVVKRDASGIILTYVQDGHSTIIVTIDPENSSFVYSTQNASEMWNRVSTFVGRCFRGP